MNSAHFVRDFNLDISFASEQEALAGASRLSSFASDRLVAVAHEVFNRFDLAAGMVLSIDSLEVDLGDLPVHGCYEEAEIRFRRWLEERLALEVYRNRSLPGETARASAWLVPAGQRDLDLVVYWLENGYLPWNVPRLDLPALRRLLDQVAWQQGAQLASRLRATVSPNSVAHRLARHSSGRLEQRITDLLQSLSGDEDSSAANLRDSTPQNWESQLLALLEDRGDPIDVPGAIRQAIVAGDPNPSGASLQRLVRRYPDVVAALIRSEGARPEVLRTLAAGFDDSLLGQIVHALEPSEGRFILAAIRQPALYGEAVRLQASSAAQTRALVWEFALAYLIVDRGSEFNRRSFMRSIIQRMAAHCNRDYASLVVSLHEAFSSAAAQSPEQRGLLPILDELHRHEISSVATREAANLHENPVSVRPLPEQKQIAGDMAETTRHSDAISGGRGEYALRDLLLQVGADPILRNLIAQRLSLQLLLDLVDALDLVDTSERQFIRDLTGALALVGDSLGEGFPSGHELARLLWEVTLVHLQRGNFDKSLYIESALRRFVGRYGLDPRRLLNAAEATLSFGRIAGESQEEILVLLRQLKQRSRGTAFSESAEVWMARFATALRQADRERVGTLWQRWPKTEVATLLGLFRQIAASPSARRRLRALLPIEVARDAVEAASPGDLAFMLRIAEFAGTLPREVLPGDDESIQRTVWHSLLMYASRRGGPAFDWRGGLDAVLRGLAVHHNLRYGDLLSSIHELSGDAALASRMPPAFWLFVAERRDANSVRGLETRKDAAVYEDTGHVELLESYDLYDAVIRFASRADKSEANPLATLLSRLRTEFPSTWRRIVRESEPLQRSATSAPQYFSSEPHLIFFEESGWSILLPAATGARTEAGSAAEAGRELPYALIRDRKLNGPLPGAIAAALDDAALVSRDASAGGPVVDPLMDLAEDEGAIRGLIRLLPERRLAKLILARAPRGFERQMAMAELMADAADLHDHALIWEFLFDQVQALQGAIPEALTQDAEFVGALLRLLAKQTNAIPSELREATIRHLRKPAGPGTSENAKRLLDALDRALPPTPAPIPLAPIPTASRSVARTPRVRQSHDDPIFVANAGLVLAGHYLPRLFDSAGLFEAGRFKDQEAVERGVCLLQYLVDGSIEAPEHLLPLNKILCGLEPEEPIVTQQPLTSFETEVADGLLEAILAHWSALGRTSVQALRESFLQREGRISLAPPAWQLLVEPRAYDMLLDRLPWSFNVIKHKWMDKAIFVEWR